MLIRLGVVLHVLSAIVCCGGAVHLAVVMWKLAGNEGRQRLLRVYSWVSALGFLATVGLGALLYPIYRVQVRAAFLEQAYPWVVRLFEVKEHWGAIGMATALALLWLLRRAHYSPRQIPLRLTTTLATLAAALAAFCIIAGLVTALHRPL